MDVHARSASTGWMTSPPQASNSVSRSGCPPIGEVFALVRASYARPARASSPGTGAAPQSGKPGTVFADPDQVTLVLHPRRRAPDRTFRRLNSSMRLEADIAAPLRPGRLPNRLRATGARRPSRGERRPVAAWCAAAGSASGQHQGSRHHAPREAPVRRALVRRTRA